MPEFVGKVTRRLFGRGSKSEHEAVYFETGQNRYVLRRQGGNPFHDRELDRLVGKTVRCSGVVDDYTLTISDWTEIDEATLKK